VTGARDGASPLKRLLDDPPAIPAPARAELRELRGALRDCSAAAIPAAAQVARVRLFLEPVLRRRYENAEARVRDLEQLEQLASGYPSRERFVTDLALDPPTSTSDLAGPPLKDEDYLVLSTIHSAKGGEWDVVHVIHAADGMIPSDMATGDDERIEEERRLFYVALTRARDALYVYFPLRYRRSNRGPEDRHWYAQLTRFLPEGVRDLFEQRATYTDDERDGAVGVAAGRVDGVDALIRGLWTN
jgi:DNA helicase-2/ATP-dependent DNA helicase PcrA